MPESHNQKSFHAGELAPNLYARVDLAKYHSAAALLRNFFVDYRGGASTRMGTKYILQAYKSATAVRLISFSASFTVSYVLEFGNFYVRFYNNGSVVLETAGAITGISQANPASVTQVAHGYQTGDWVYITGVGGMTQVNGKYYSITRTGANTYTLANLNGVAVNSTAYTAYTAGGTGARVYTVPTPYAAADLATLKYAQNVNTLVLTHSSYVPYVLTLISATNWTLTPITFGSTVTAPTGVAVVSTLGAGTVNYAYIVTAVDQNGQESAASSVAALANILDILTNAGSHTVSWTAVSGAIRYNVYKSVRRYGAAVAAGVAFGYIGTTTGVSFADTTPGLDPDFSSTPPITQNPFQGAGVVSVTVTAAGVYAGAVPTMTFGAAPAGGHTATGNAVLQVQGTPALVANGASPAHFVGEVITFTNGVAAVVATVAGFNIATFQPITYPGSNPGSVSSGSVPANPVTGTGSGGTCTANLTWGVGIVQVISPGDGYTAAPAVTFSAGAAAATAVLGSSSLGNPAVPAYFQQRLVLAGPAQSPQTFYMSQPGSYYNYNVSNPIQADDAITGTIVARELNPIKSMLPMPNGLITLGSRQAWLINGGSAQTPITPIDATANAQAYNGASDVPPIVVNYDILYVQAKGSIVRDLTYNFYTNIYTGTDISILSSHLFFAYQITGWAYAEEPFKIIWAIRNDGTLLSLTYLKEQEVQGWSHHDTSGLFKSVASVTEAVDEGNVDAVYFVVQRTINGNTVQYIERMADRFLSSGEAPDDDVWCVDAGLQYDGAPATSFSGGEHLALATVTGLADGVPITPFIMPATGNFTLAAASVVTIGLAYSPQLQTLILDLGEPTVIGKLKKIIAVTVRGADTIGIRFGRTLAAMIPMKDFSGSQNAAGVTVSYALATLDARQPIDPKWDQDGQYFIDQPYPLPATILGVVPEIKVEDRK